jgi:hypothetical protein
MPPLDVVLNLSGDGERSSGFGDQRGVDCGCSLFSAVYIYTLAEHASFLGKVSERVLSCTLEVRNMILLLVGVGYLTRSPQNSIRLLVDLESRRQHTER